MDDHAGFNGFTQTDFVGQQHAGCMTMTDFTGDMQLMRDQTHTTAGQTTGWVPTTSMLVGQRFITQRKTGMTVDLAGKQTVLRFIKFDEVIQHHFTQCDFRTIIHTGAVIGQQTIGFFDSTYIQLPLFMAGNTVAFIKTDTSDGRTFAGIQTLFAISGEQ